MVDSCAVCRTTERGLYFFTDSFDHVTAFSL